MADITQKPYANWLEKTLQDMFSLNHIESICIMTKSTNGVLHTGYYDCSVADKILFAGFLQQDAMIETLQDNGYVDCNEEEFVGDDIEEDEENEE